MASQATRARTLGLALLAKDTVKEALAVLEDEATLTIDRSRELGSASFEVVFAIAAQNSGAVLEASWNPALAGERLAGLSRPLIEVHCQCPPEVARQRYVERAGRRHWYIPAGPATSGWADPGPRTTW